MRIGRSWWVLLAIACAGCSAVASDPPPHPVRTSAKPMRIVSTNPCVDAVLTEVADPGQIAGISHYSQDPRATSMAVDFARRFTATSGTAEEVVALAPDLVITGAHVTPATVAALKRLGIPLVQVGVPATIGESIAQVREIARAAGQPERGEALVARIEAAIERARPRSDVAVPGLIWLGGGLVPGQATLADEMLRLAGFHNLSADYGLASWDVLPIEHLVARPPRVLLTVGAARQEDAMLSHPVLAHMTPRMAIRAFPERLLHCGGPTIIAALDQLAAARATL